MKMTSIKFGILAAVFLAVSGVRAEQFLYWGLFNPTLRQGGEEKSAAEAGAAFAQIGVYDYDPSAGGKAFSSWEDPMAFLEFYKEVDGRLVDAETDLELVQNGKAGPLWAGMGDYSSEAYWFAIVLYSGDQNLLGVSEVQNYEDLQKYFVSESEIWAHKTEPWTGGTYMVPEPTGGLLVLFGLCVFGLRRKEESV